MKQENFLNDLAYVPSKYSKGYNHYAKTQIKVVMPFLTSIASTCHYGSQFPICKVLKAISKFFLLNEIQVLFLAYIIRETNWDIKDRIITSNAQNIQDIVCYAIQNLDYKRIILYLMVSAFTVKYYLNKDTSEELEEATKRCPNFKHIFENWAKKHSSIATKINPRSLNTVYKHLYSDSRKQKKNFNIIVDSILQISPAYNPQKDKAKKQEKKKSYNNQQANIKQENLMLKHDKTGFISATPFFGSNGFYNLLPYNQNSPTEEMNMNPFMPFKSDRIRQEHIDMLGSSIIGLKDESNISGYNDLLSNQDVEKQKFNEQPMQSFGMIGLNKGISITEKYISSEAKIEKSNNKQAEDEKEQH